MDVLRPEPIVVLFSPVCYENEGITGCTMHQEHKRGWSVQPGIRLLWALITGPDGWRGKWMTDPGRSRPTTITGAADRAQHTAQTSAYFSGPG